MKTGTLFLLVIFSLTACKKEEKEPRFKIGQAYQGGIIFYVDNSGEHGLIAAPNDQGQVPWGCQTEKIAGAEGIVIGTGEQNTIDIIQGCRSDTTAAHLSAELVLNGYSDWYLPSKDELYELYLNKSLVGNFATDAVAPYWSSTEYEINFGAWRQVFANGEQTIYDKYNVYNVRAIRRF